MSASDVEQLKTRVARLEIAVYVVLAVVAPQGASFIFNNLFGLGLGG